MEVIRVNKAKGTLRDVVHAEPQAVIDNITQCLRDGGRGAYVLPPPVRDCAGGVKLAGVDIGDTELLHRYCRMSFEARKALVRSLCYKMHAHQVREIEIEVEWGTSVTRTLAAYLRIAIDDKPGEVLYLGIMPVKK